MRTLFLSTLFSICSMAVFAQFKVDAVRLSPFGQLQEVKVDAVGLNMSIAGDGTIHSAKGGQEVHDPQGQLEYIDYSRGRMNFQHGVKSSRVMQISFEGHTMKLHYDSSDQLVSLEMGSTKLKFTYKGEKIVEITQAGQSAKVNYEASQNGGKVSGLKSEIDGLSISTGSK